MTFSYWYNMKEEEVCQYWQTDPKQGLYGTVVARRLRQYGPNHLREGKGTSPVFLFFNQFTDFMVVVLLVAVLLSGFLKQWDDALTILAIVVINAILGFIQEFRAERSLAALKRLNAPVARVIRQGRIQGLSAEELVPGDIIELEAGDRVPADARLLEAANLECSEAPLTGESAPVGKNPSVLKSRELLPGDRQNMLFAGTTITRGKGRAIVVATGMNTELGRIAHMLERVEQETTPLQQRLAHLGQWLVVLCFLICAAVVILGIWRGESAFNMIMAGISLAVAAIPEGLPAIVTLALALGVQRMIKRRAVIRKLPAVETLGCATVVCSDKTGTLTKNEMTVQEIFVNNRVIMVTGKGFSPNGDFRHREGQPFSPAEEHLKQLLTIGVLCNNCRLEREKGELLSQDEWKITGDPTEGALQVAAAKAGLNADDVNQSYPRLKEIPFEAERRRMTTVHRYPGAGKQLVCTKGAPDVILELSSQIYEDGKLKPLTAEKLKKLEEVMTDMTSRALRVLAVAMGELPDDKDFAPDELEKQLVFVGFVGIIDPPREEVPAAIARCQQAGIKVVMVTGDHPNTAVAIARELGLLVPGGRCLTGRELDGLSQQELEDKVEGVTVFARVSPRHKLRIVKALKKRGHIVAMTGDGVNDAPAVKEADIGIAMGITGTDVTKEASAMVIQDDNFATIVAAVEEGRGIYDNIRKFIRYLLGCNMGEVITMFLAALLSLPLPLLPIQILWINLVTDGLPALALGVEPTEPGIMERAPRHPAESVFSRGLTGLIIGRGFQIALCTLIVFVVAGFAWNNLALARTMAFTSLVVLQLLYVFECRTEKDEGFPIWGNPYLLLAVFTSIMLQLMVLYFPFFHRTFQTFALQAQHWAIIMVVSLAPVFLRRIGLWQILWLPKNHLAARGRN